MVANSLVKLWHWESLLLDWGAIFTFCVRPATMVTGTASAALCNVSKFRLGSNGRRRSSYRCKFGTVLPWNI